MVSGRLATISAPLVENGETSTIVEATASAATTATALTCPMAINGIAIGTMIGSSAVAPGEAERDRADDGARRRAGRADRAHHVQHDQRDDGYELRSHERSSRTDSVIQWPSL